MPKDLADFRFLFANDEGFIRLPVWGHIALSKELRRLINHPHFLRLRQIRQLSFVESVFPGATHARFEHSIGVFHLMKLILQSLVLNPQNTSYETDRFCITPETAKLLLTSAVLHDIGHYPHAHIVEQLWLTEAGEPVFEHHQEMAVHYIHQPPDDGGPTLADLLRDDWGLDPDRVVELIRGDKRTPYAKILSGTLDPDKMDYLIRDAHHCTVPYGSVDIHRLIESFVLDGERERLGITEKGIAPLESLLFAKYMMMRHIYWHHTVRAMGSMFKRLLQDIIDSRAIDVERLRTMFYTLTDDRLPHALAEALPSDFSSRLLLENLINRRPHKRGLTLYFRPEGEPVARDEERFVVRIPRAVSERLALGEQVADGSVGRYFALKRLNDEPMLRKAREIAICNLLNELEGLTGDRALRGFEVLIDVPPFGTIFEYRDFRELRVLVEAPTDPGMLGWQPFQEVGDSQFKPDFVAEFEAYTKKVRVLAVPEVVPMLHRHADRVLELLTA